MTMNSKNLIRPMSLVKISAMKIILKAEQLYYFTTSIIPLRFTVQHANKSSRQL